MLHLFRGGGENVSGGHAVLASHILGKFLKRLGRMDRPRLLDLGRLSGSNIEFFASARCRVQVDDLLAEGPRGGLAEGPAGAFAETHRPAAGPGQEIKDRNDGPTGEPAAPVALSGNDAGTAAGRPSSPAATQAALRPMQAATGFARIGTARPDPSAPPGTGARPSRRIVLPPRAFPRQGPVTASTPPAPARAAGRRTGIGIAAPALPTTFSYADESFDAIVAWDIFNFYPAAAMHDLAAEVRRVLKPGGLLLAYFHARNLDRPDHPRRYRIIDEKRVACDVAAEVPLARHVYQNRDIEKMFAGLTIVELYFLKNSMREMLLEKKAPHSSETRPLVRPATGRASRFTLE